MPGRSYPSRMDPAATPGREPADGGAPSAGDFGVELARRRDRHGWSVHELARRANVSAGHISNLESGRRNASVAVAAACDAALRAGGVLIERADAARRDAREDVPVDADVLVAGLGQVLESLKDWEHKPEVIGQKQQCSDKCRNS